MKSISKIEKFSIFIHLGLKVRILVPFMGHFSLFSRLLCNIAVQIWVQARTKKWHNFWTVGQIEVISFLKSVNFSSRIRFCTLKRGELTANMRRLFSLISFHLLRPVTYDEMTQLKNPSADILHSKSTRASEKMSINKVRVGKLDTEEYMLENWS